MSGRRRRSEFLFFLPCFCSPPCVPDCDDLVKIAKTYNRKRLLQGLPRSLFSTSFSSTDLKMTTADSATTRTNTIGNPGSHRPVVRTYKGRPRSFRKTGGFGRTHLISIFAGHRRASFIERDIDELIELRARQRTFGGKNQVSI